MKAHTVVVKLAAIALFPLIAASCATASDDASIRDSAPPAPTTAAELVGRVRDPLPFVGDLTLPEAGAGDFAFAAPSGSLLIVYFGYTYCPDVCPTTLADVRTALRDMESRSDRVEVAMVTIDPNRDTDERLTDYVRAFFSDGHALRTNDDDRLSSVTAAFRALYGVEDEGDGNFHVVHTADLYVIDDQGLIQVVWPFGTTPHDMESDLGILLERA